MLVSWTTFHLVHAPVPVLHEHGGQLDGQVWTASLGGHLATYHPLDLDHDWFAWHVHWVDPSDLASGECPDGQSNDDPPADRHMVVQGNYLLPAFLLLDRCLAGVEADDLTTGDSSDVHSSRYDLRHRQFLEFCTSTLPVRAYLCIARC